MSRQGSTIRCAALAGLLVLAAGITVGQQRPELGIVEKLGQSLPLDAELYDESGNLVQLGSFVDRPIILTFVYYRCPGICSPLLTELTRVVEKMDLVPGVDYRLVTISFDHREAPTLAASKKGSYIAAMTKKIDPAGWRFFTGDSVTIARITDAAGFYFKPEGNDFVHAGALIILSPQGNITRYMNGIQYLPFDVKMALIEASEGKVRPTIAKILKFCYSYDPEAKTYALNITRISLVIILFLAVVFVVVLLRPRKKTLERDARYGQSV